MFTREGLGATPKKAAWKIHATLQLDGSEYRSWWVISNRMIATRYEPHEGWDADKVAEPIWLDFQGEVVDLSNYKKDDLISVEGKLKEAVAVH